MKQLWTLVLAALGACHSDTGKTCTSAEAAHITIMTIDDSSPTMRKIYEHVEADPAATRAGIQPQIDTWQTDGQSRHTDYFLLGPDPAAITKYVASLAPELQPPSTDKLMFERVVGSAGWRSYLVSSIVVDQTAIARVAAIKTDGHPRLMITFTPEGSKTFAAATEKAIGHKMATVVDGEITSAPVINAKVSGGKAMISFSSDAEAAALAKKLGC